MSEHLTPLDATFLELEEADESAHMHIGGIMVFDPLPGGGAPSREQLCEHLAGRLARLPRYAQRLSEPHTGGLSWPTWEDDPRFELSRHVARVALPAPGDYEELSEWASGFFSQRLDRHRPLWEMALVEGLADGRWALAHKTHHCMVDGVGSVDVGYLLLDTAQDAPPHTGSASGGHGVLGVSTGSPASSSPASDAPGNGRLGSLAHGAARLLPVETIVRTARMGAHGALHPLDAVRAARSALELILREEVRSAPHTSLNVAIGTRRRFDVVRFPLADLKTIKNSLGGTINDVALAVSASGLRALLRSREESLPPGGLRAMVPMNVRAASEHLALGNRVSSLFMDLPVEEPNVLARYRETVSRSLSLKSDGRQAAGTAAVIELAGLAPPVLHVAIARALYATRLFNLTITNVPGPQQTLYAFGAPLREIHPLVPLAAAHAVGIAVLSYDGEVAFGVVADRDVVPDLDVMLGAMRESAAQLLAAARAGASGRGAPRKPAARSRRVA
jgi:diacylglycerol O-acyltransferase